VLTGTTLAYFTTADTARNVVTSGGVDIAVVEERIVDGELVPYPDEKIPVMPSANVSKVVSVRSLEKSAWIRAKFEAAFYEQDGSIREMPAEEIKKLVRIEADELNWSYKDGWWYYAEPIAAGSYTAPLFESVSFAGAEMGNEYQRCTVKINVVAQAVQQANNGRTVFEAQGWSED